jgi:DNA-directed RNA polymerase subunit M/transcription elongation factor TFIIS
MSLHNNIRQALRNHVPDDIKEVLDKVRRPNADVHEIVLASLHGAHHQRHASRGVQDAYKKELEEYDIIKKSKRKDLMQCPSCKGHDVEWMSKQTRSADEGATIFYECKSCGNAGRFNN